MSDEEENNNQFHHFPLSIDKVKKLPNWLKTLVSVTALIIFSLALVGTLIGIAHLTSEIYNNYLYPKSDEAFAKIRNSLFILAALIGVPFFLWRTNIAQSQANTARDRAYTELFTKAIEQLGAEKPAKIYQYHTYEEQEDEFGLPIYDSKTGSPYNKYKVGEEKLDANNNHMFKCLTQN